jgi:DNA-binding protein HU-beta
MNKTDLINRIAKDAGVSKPVANKALNAVIDGITASLKKGQKITLVGFGTFSVAERKARTGRNPRTKAPIKIPAKKVVRFKAGKNLKDVVK